MRSRFFALTFAVFLALPASIRASDDDNGLGNALSVARAWLGEIDAGRYEQSYNEAGSVMRDKVPKDSWIKILRTERPPLGKTAHREEVSHVLHTDGLEGTSGTFLVVTYHTDFASKSDEVEYVILRHEFGGWRCVGYDFGPANPQPASGDTQSSTTTTDETLAPPTPTNGMVVPARPQGSSH